MLVPTQKRHNGHGSFTIVARQQNSSKGPPMFKNTPFETIAKTLTDSVPKFDPAAMQNAVGPAQENLKAWVYLAQSQAKEAQAAAAQTLEALKDIKDPQAAFELMQASAEAGMVRFAKNLREASALGVGQFHNTVDAVEKAHPAKEAFAPVAKNLKAAASSAESALETAMDKGAAAMASMKPGAKAKKPR
jgi:hypothetical protein